MTIQTYQGVVRQGKVELNEYDLLPEGSHVTVMMTNLDQHLLVSARRAKRKATGWLVGYVGNMVTAESPHLVEKGEQLVWRFGAFITGRGKPLQGPFAFIEVDAQSGDVLADEKMAQKLIENGTEFARSL